MEIASVPYKSILNGSNIMKPNYHLNYGKKRIERAIKNKKSFTPLGDAVRDVFTGGIFKRVFVEKEEFGLPYISAQHMMNSNPLEVAKTISKKYTPRQEDMTLRSSQILVSCAGTVGNVRLIGEDLDGVIGSQDIIRVISDEDSDPYGFIYAYLASPTAYNYIQSYIYGSVVPRIEPNTLAKLPVPNFSDRLKQEIHNLIVEATNLRVEANKLLSEAVELMEEKLPSIEFRSVYKTKILARINHNSRIEATYNTNSIEGFYEALEQSNTELKSISELSQQVFTPGIFKRIRTNNPEKGVPFLSGSDLLNQYPNFQSFLSRKMKNIDNYILYNGWLAIQDAGTIGYLSYITKFLDGVSATNNLVRVVPNEDDNKNYYIYCFFKTKVGQRLLKSLEYGSVQKHIDNHQVSNFKVPMFKVIEEQITRKVKKCMDNLGDACFLEKEAIDLVEKEIESWQK